MYYEDPLMYLIHIWPDGRYRALDFISTNPVPRDNLGVKVIDFILSHYFCLRVKVFTLKFIRPHILKTL